MAAPTTVARNTGVSSTTNSTSYTSVGFGAGTRSTGERIYVFVTADGNGTLTTAVSGWNKVDQETNGTVVTQALFYYDVTDGSQAVASLVVDNTASEQYSHAYIVVAPAASNTITHITPTKANGSSTNSDPASFTNNSGASQDFLVLVSRGGDSTTVATVAPTNYNNLQSQAGGGTNGASTNSAERTITVANTASENPGTFTSGNEQWTCFTVGVYQVATGGSATLAAGSGSYSISGTATALQRSRIMAAASASYSISGTNATLAKGKTLSAAPETEINGDPSFDTPGYWNLSFGTGWSITGGAAVGSSATGFVVRSPASQIVSGNTYKVVVTVSGYSGGSFQAYVGSGSGLGPEISGNGTFTQFITAPASNEFGLKGATAFTGNITDLSITQLTYAITGTDVAFRRNYVIAALTTSYAITGTAAVLQSGIRMAAGAASYAITGTAAVLVKGKAITAAAGSYAITGTAAALKFTRILVAASGTYAITGTAAVLKTAKKLVAASASYAISGTTAALSFGKNLAATAGSYIITGASAVLVHTLAIWQPTPDATGSWSDVPDGAGTWTPTPDASGTWT